MDGASLSGGPAETAPEPKEPGKSHGDPTIGPNRDETRSSTEAIPRRLLELVLSGAPLESVLTSAVLLLESEIGPDVRASILLVRDGRLWHGAAPNLPEEYLQAIDGVPIGPEGGACGAAAAANETVSVADVENDPRVAAYAPLALRFGLRACWSMPIRGTNGSVLGTFALYHGVPREPAPEDLGLVEILTRTVALAIENRGAQEALAASEAEYRATFDCAAVGIAHVSLEGRILRLNDACCRILGDSRERLLGSHFSEITHPDDLKADQEQAQRLANGEIDTYSMDKRYIRADGSVAWANLTVSLIRDTQGRPTKYVSVVEDIGARTRAQSELKRLVDERTSELARHLATTQAISDNAESALLLVDAQGRITQANPAFYRATGFDAEDAVGRYGHDLLHAHRPDGSPYPAAQCPIFRAWVDRTPLLRHEDVFFRKDGRPFPVVVSLTPVSSDTQEVQSGVIEFRDVTREKEAERELRRRKERYQFLAEAIPIPVWSCDPDGTPTFVSDRWRKRHGYGDGPISAEAWNECVHPDDRPGMLEEWRRCTAAVRPFAARCRLRLANGGYRWHHCVGTPELVDGQVTEWIGANVDIHDQTERERTLELANRVGRTLAEDLDYDRIVGALTEASLEVTEARVGAFFRRSGEMDTFRGASREWFEAPEVVGLVRRVLQESSSVRVDEARLSGLGSYLAAPVVSRSGETIGGLLVGHPAAWHFTPEHEHLVSIVASQAAVAIDNAILYERQSRLNEELTAARDEALAASRTKSQFLANVSHEIRTPLNGVVGMTSLLLASGLRGEALEAAETIARSGETLLRVIDDVLDVSKIEAGRLEIERVATDLSQLTEDVVALYLVQARQKGIALTVMAPAKPAPWVLADPVRLRQVLANLVSNAVKFTERGSVELIWRWQERKGGVSVAFEVHDSGIGIPADRLDRVFESFTQADGSTQRRYGGTGLGLTISRQLVSLMNGRLGVASEVGRGTTFTVRLEFEIAGGAGDLERPGPDQTPIPAGLRVLLAEDNDVNVLVARRMLESLRCEIDFAQDGLQAIAMAAEGNYDLVLMDVQMPLCDGIAATRAIRLRESLAGSRRTPIVALTANAMLEDREKCLAAGMDDFLPKPIRVETLRRTLASLVPKAPG